MHLPAYIGLIVIFVPMDSAVQEEAVKVLMIVAFALMLLMIPVCIFNVVVSIRSAIKGDEEIPKSTMIMKLSLIPWYALNFFIGFVICSFFLNPFVMIAIPVIIAILSTSTYILMLSTSVGDIAYSIRSCIKREWRVTPALVFALIFSFIFCLDVVGAIMLYSKSQKAARLAQAERSEERAEPSIEGDNGEE